jgi:hypothetical protein
VVPTTRRRCRSLVVAGVAVAVLLGAIDVARPAGAQAPGRLPASPRAETQTIKAKKDTFVASNQADSNFGRSSQLYVGQASDFGATRTLVYFDLKDLDRKYVVRGGELRLYVRVGGPAGDPSRDVVLYRVTGDWGEDSATWNNFPGWDDNRLASRAIGTGSGWYGWDVDGLLRDWYSEKTTNRGFYVQGYEAGGSFRQFDSREAGQKPELKLEVEIDDKPPFATLNPLPPYLASSDVALSWAKGTDPEPSSGIVTYEIWFQRGTDPWQLAGKDLGKDTTAYTFKNAENGRFYGFQVLAVDRAGLRQLLGAAQATTLVDFSAPTSSLGALPEWSTGPITLMPSGHDLPDAPGLASSGIKHYDIDYNVNGGAWAPLAYSHPPNVAHVITAPPDGATMQFRVRAVDQAGNVPDFGPVAATTKVDLSAPTTWMEPTSALDTPTFRVRWDGKDGFSGLDSFDVDYRVASGTWQSWVTASKDRFKDFTGEYNVLYEFRSRARDIAGNQGAYPTAAQLTVVVIDSSTLTHPIWLPHLEDPSPAPGE